MEDIGEYLFLILFLVVGFLRWVGSKFQQSQAQREFDEGELRRESEHWEVEEDESWEEEAWKEKETFPPLPPPIPTTPTPVTPKKTTLPSPVSKSQAGAGGLSKDESAALKRIREAGTSEAIPAGNAMSGKRRPSSSDDVIEGALKLVKGPHSMKQAMIIKEILDEPKGLKW